MFDPQVPCEVLRDVSLYIQQGSGSDCAAARPVRCGLCFDGWRHEVISHSEGCRRSVVYQDVE